jgi:hypothetical protein
MNFGYLTPYLTFKPPTHTKIKRSNIPGYAILERFDTCFFQTERCLPLRLPHPHPGPGVPLLLPHPLLQQGSGVALLPLLLHLLPWECQLLHSTRYLTSLKLYSAEKFIPNIRSKQGHSMPCSYTHTSWPRLDKGN